MMLFQLADHEVFVAEAAAEGLTAGGVVRVPHDVAGPVERAR
jgi:hypothetical protein